MRKVFCIGLSHTGTKSLTSALELLGCRAVHYPLDRQTYRELSTGRFRLSILDRFDAVADITVAPYFKDLDRAWPGSKFILTTRDRGAWLASMQKINADWLAYANRNPLLRFGRRFLLDWRETGLGALRSTWFRIRHERQIDFYRIATYGVLACQDEARLTEVYEDHHRRVADYFAQRPDDLLVMDLAKGDGWRSLCPFLGVSEPDVPFPHVYDKRRRQRQTARDRGSAVAGNCAGSGRPPPPAAPR